VVLLTSTNLALFFIFTDQSIRTTMRQVCYSYVIIGTQFWMQDFMLKEAHILQTESASGPGQGLMEQTPISSRELTIKRCKWF